MGSAAGRSERTRRAVPAGGVQPADGGDPAPRLSPRRAGAVAGLLRRLPGGGVRRGARRGPRGARVLGGRVGGRAAPGPAAALRPRGPGRLARGGPVPRSAGAVRARSLRRRGPGDGGAVPGAGAAGGCRIGQRADRPVVPAPPRTGSPRTAVGGGGRLHLAPDLPLPVRTRRDRRGRRHDPLLPRPGRGVGVLVRRRRCVGPPPFPAVGAGGRGDARQFGAPGFRGRLGEAPLAVPPPSRSFRRSGRRSGLRFGLRSGLRSGRPGAFSRGASVGGAGRSHARRRLPRPRRRGGAPPALSAGGGPPTHLPGADRLRRGRRPPLGGRPPVRRAAADPGAALPRRRRGRRAPGLGGAGGGAGRPLPADGPHGSDLRRPGRRRAGRPGLCVRGGDAAGPVLRRPAGPGVPLREGGVLPGLRALSGRVDGADRPPGRAAAAGLDRPHRPPAGARGLEGAGRALRVAGGGPRRPGDGALPDPGGLRDRRARPPGTLAGTRRAPRARRKRLRRDRARRDPAPSRPLRGPSGGRGSPLLPGTLRPGRGRGAVLPAPLPRGGGRRPAGAPGLRFRGPGSAPRREVPGLGPARPRGIRALPDRPVRPRRRARLGSVGAAGSGSLAPPPGVPRRRDPGRARRAFLLRPPSLRQGVDLPPGTLRRRGHRGALLPAPLRPGGPGAGRAPAFREPGLRLRRARGAAGRFLRGDRPPAGGRGGGGADRAVGRLGAALVERLAAGGPGPVPGAAGGDRFRRLRRAGGAGGLRPLSRREGVAVPSDAVRAGGCGGAVLPAPRAAGSGPAGGERGLRQPVVRFRRPRGGARAGVPGALSARSAAPLHDRYRPA